MFNKPPEDRISVWFKFRESIESSQSPLIDVCDFWRPAPFIAYNPNIDPYHFRSWPTPWEIIVENKYDDFTKTLMIGWTLKLTKKYSNSKIELRTLVDNEKPAIYNVCCVDEQWVLNYNDEKPILLSELPNNLLVENLIELTALR